MSAMSQFREFLKDVRVEAGRVSWPTRDELRDPGPNRARRLDLQWIGATPDRRRGAAATATEAGMSDKKWYVIHTYSGHENKVKTNLEKAIHSAGLDEQFGQILVMTEEVVEMKDGKRKTSKRKTFPSYVVVEMALSNETRHLVQNVPGVTKFVGSGAREVPLKENEVRRLLGQMETSKTRPTPTVQFSV